MKVVSEGRFHRVIDVRTDAGGIQRGIECKRCHQVSFNPSDVANGYCGACHVWLADREATAEELSARGMETHLTKPLLCSRCRVKMELATCAEESKSPPAEGDAMVCAYCGHVNVFDAAGQLRDVVPDDWKRWSPSTQALTLNAAKFFKAMAAAHRGDA